MKAFILLLLVAVAFSSHSQGRWKGKRYDWRKGFQRSRFVSDQRHSCDSERTGIPCVRICCKTLCEMRKCERMVMELNYKYEPRIQWSCVMPHKPNMMTCMKMVEERKADLMGIPGIKADKAERYYNLVPILKEKYDNSAIPQYEKRFKQHEESDGDLKHYTVALTEKGSGIESWKDLAGKRSCHYDVTTHATFKNPMCSLIAKGVIPVKGNVYESTAEFFKKSCVPGAKCSGYWNRNGTMPDSLCSLCRGTGDSFCQMKKNEPLYGYDGAVKCLQKIPGQDIHGHVGFFHTYDVLKNIDKLNPKYALVCKNQNEKLTWDFIKNPNCHINIEYANVVVVRNETSVDLRNKIISVLLTAVTKYNSKIKGDFNFFSSESYCPTTDDDVLWRKKNLIFNDRSSGFIRLSPNKPFLEPTTVETMKMCKSLHPKPRAFICVVGEQEKQKCLDIKKYFAQTPTTSSISLGCVEASCRYECMRKVQRGECDIVALNATEMYIAGKEFNLAPFIGENHRNKMKYTESLTVGVIRKDNQKPITELKNYKMCFRADQMLTSYYHPLGLMLANGTIPRTRDTVITEFFSGGCFPGIDKFDLTRDYVSKHLLDWDSLVSSHTPVDWTTWYQTPEWIKREQNIPYHRWHTRQNFKCKKFEYLKRKLYTTVPWKRCKVHVNTTEWKEKVDSEFNWDNYKFEDFYSIFPCAKFVLNLLNESQFENKYEMYAFMDWAKLYWKNKMCLHTEYKLWDESHWTKFKALIDDEYQHYFRNLEEDEEPMDKDTFIRFYVLSSRLEYLRTEWRKLQWTHPQYKQFRSRFCSTCRGKTCSMENAMTSNHQDILQCVYNKLGDLGFMDAFKLESLIRRNSYSRSDFMLVCPCGKKVEYTGPQSFMECNFGRVPTKALVTCQSHDAVWRSKVTKVFLEAQKVFKGAGFNRWNYNMFESNALFSKNIHQLVPIELIEQTYQQWLGPRFLRSLEGLFYNTPWKSDRHSYKDYEEYDRDYSGDEEDDDENDYEYGYYKDYDYKKEYKQRYGKKMEKYSYKRKWGNYRSDKTWKKSRCSKGETYTTVIRNKTCTGISEEMKCFGEPRVVKRCVGDVTKTTVTVHLCHVPSAYVKKYIEFTCSNGVGITEPVMVPTKCSYLPCTKNYWIPEWRRDTYWRVDNPYRFKSQIDMKILEGYKQLSREERMSKHH